MIGILALIFFFGLFTIFFILIEDTLRYVYKVKMDTDHKTLNIVMWYSYIKALRWQRANIWRGPMVILANGLIVFGIIFWTALLSSPVWNALNTLFIKTLGQGGEVFGDIAVLLLISGWSWRVVIPRVYTRYIKDKENRLAALFRDRKITST